MGSNVEAVIVAKMIKQPRGIIGAKPDIDQICADITDIVELETFEVYGTTTIHAVQECRWETTDADMKKLSAMYPGVLFTVKIVIKDYDVNELHYYYEGKTHEAVITFSPFDESKLV